MECRYCSSIKQTSRSLQQHELRCPVNPNVLPLWNKGITKDNDPRLAVISASTSARLKGRKKTTPSPLKGRKTRSTGCALNPAVELERRRKIREVAIKRKLGGYQPGSGRGKKGWCRGFFCDSSWELAFVLYHTDHGSDIKRCKTPRTYEFKGKIKRYFPDFVVNGSTYEIKGYKTEQWDAKQKANPDVIPIFETDLKPILNYVVDKYGKDYISMYEHGR